MGVLARQSFNKTVVLAIGVAVGILSTLFIYPLDREVYGFLTYIIHFALFLGPLFGVGVIHTTVKFYPMFSTDHKDKTYIWFAGLYSIVLSVFFGAVFIVFPQEIGKLLKSIGFDQDRVFTYFSAIWFLCLLFLWISSLEKICTLYKRVAIPSIINAFSQKVILPMLVLAFFFGRSELTTLLWIYVAYRCAVFLGLIFYLFRLDMFVQDSWFSFRSGLKYVKSKFKGILNYSLWSWLNVLGLAMAYRLDVIMVGGLVNFEAAGSYAIGLTIANVISLPYDSINPLMSAQVAKSFNRNDLITIERDYKRSGLILFILSVLMALLILSSIQDVFRLTPNSEILLASFWVIFYIAMAKVINMVTSVNQAIIIYSKYYRWNVLFMFISGALTIGLNLYLIPRQGMIGAAIATFISLLLFNIIKLIFIYIVFKIHPFTWNILWVFLVAILTSVVVYFIPFSGIAWLDIILRSALILLIFAFPIYYFRISEELSEAVEKYYKMVIKFLPFR